ncbi:MAG: hypothetical protein MAG453_01515 [Calditrichaeota bacterium]|nr:hypothetical protein [Calditrichota bacterium]
MNPGLKSGARNETARGAEDSGTLAAPCRAGRGRPKTNPASPREAGPCCLRYDHAGLSSFFFPAAGVDSLAPDDSGSPSDEDDRDLRPSAPFVEGEDPFRL